MGGLNKTKDNYKIFMKTINLVNSLENLRFQTKRFQIELPYMNRKCHSQKGRTIKLKSQYFSLSFGSGIPCKLPKQHTLLSSPIDIQQNCYMILLIPENKALDSMKGRSESHESQADHEKSSPGLLYEWQRCCEDSAGRQKDINNNKRNKTSGLIQV